MDQSQGVRLLTSQEAAAVLKVSMSWLAKARITGVGPSYRKLGRSVRYSQSDLFDYLHGTKRSNTSQS